MPCSVALQTATHQPTLHHSSVHPDRDRGGGHRVIDFSAGEFGWTGKKAMGGGWDDAPQHKDPPFRS
ncbi:hypothetical protein CSOJ01_05343 [Colletotrichum sojae]|uniref:Uncharacterized protein n=1 Tax=Colletotrichum sojae TaxID=2175907 RepID=A0A8H6JFM0_9PEZI|nr:hypothetical protein CSOJ01_05343 [Colletotrichum sojae]